MCNRWLRREWGLCVVLVAMGLACRGRAEELTDSNLLPNGSFEFWVRPVARNSETGEPTAAVPSRWSVFTDGSAALVRSDNPHGGRHAVQVAGTRGRAVLTMSHLEVYPGATYRFGAWARGKGEARIGIDGVVMEGQQTLVEAKGPAGEDWTHVGGEFTVPRHVLDRVQVVVSVPAGMELDDVHVSAALSRPFDADAVLRDKPQRDEHTLFYEDFDGAAPAVVLAGDSKSALTDEGGGRFGRGLRLMRPGLAVFSLSLEAMPPEGTLEYWVTQDDFQKATQIALMSPGDKQSVLEIGGGAVMRVAANVASGKIGLFAPDTISCGQARAGQWLHVAVEWDAESLRLYLNGVLADVTRGRIRWPKTPSVLHSGNSLQWLCWNGVLDEVRLSSVRRHAAPVPAGFTPFPPVLPVAGAAASAAAPAQAQDSRLYDAKALREPRGKLPLDPIAPIQPGQFETTPDETGAFVYEAAALRPLIEGSVLTLTTNKQSGMVLANVRPIRAIDRYVFKDNEGAYWKLGALPEGDYWIGLLRKGGHVALYLNGRIVQLEQGGELRRAAPGLGLSEAWTGKAVRVRPGDELAVMATSGWQAARLMLRATPPPPARHYLAPHYDSHTGGPDTALAVNGQVIFRDRAGAVLPTLSERDAGRNQVVTGADALQRAPDGRPAVQCDLSNPLPTPVEVEYAVAVRSFFRLPVGGETGRVRLEPHSRLTRVIPFDALEDERAFSAELTLAVVGPQDETAWRKAMNWPPLDWISFFPGMRQGLAWPRAFKDHDLRRVEFSQPVKAARRSILLNGGREEWEEAYTADWKGPWPTAEALDWTPAVLPVKARHSARRAAALKPKAHVLYMRRMFVLPDDAESQSCAIFLEETSHAAEIYVNGVLVGGVRGGNAPLLADATAAARPGTNELVIVAHNAVAIMNPAYINAAAPEPNLQYLDAPGLWDGWAMGLGNVELRLSPRVAAHALQVIPSTRQKTLRGRFEVVNHRNRPMRVTVLARVLEGGKPVFELGRQELDIPAHRAVPVDFSKAWPDARWWWPFDPHLYVMAVETIDAATGERLDLLRDRFGFRESWIDGPHMMLNDMAIRPKGSWLGYREEPNHFARGVDGSAGPDWTDERGMMGGTYITSLGNTGTRHAVESDAYWEAVETNALRAAMVRINNPSVMRWDMSNEWLIYLYGGDPWQGAQRFKKASDLVRAFDPTRWTTFGADGDVMGLMDHFDFHYMSPYFQDGPGHPRMRGHFAYLPDGRFWRELNAGFTPGQGIPLCPHKKNVILRPDEKMLFERECLWKVGHLMPPGTTAFAGENAVLWSAWDSASGPSLWMWKQEVDGRRDLGVSLINHFTHPGLKRRAMALQTFIVPEVEHHGFGGRRLERRYAVLQDLFRTCDMTFRWTLRGADGRRLDGGEDRQRMSSGTTHRGVLGVTLPEVGARTLCTLVLELESDGERVMAEERDIAVWPASAKATEGKPDASLKAGKLARKVLLFEPEESATVQSATVQSSTVQSATVQSATVQSAKLKVEGEAPGAPPATTAAALNAAGVAFERVVDLAMRDRRYAPPDTLLILAEDALDETNRMAVAGLSGFVEAGGRVLILRQTAMPAGLPFETALDSEHWASQVYIRAGNHPVVEGWSDWDFHFWGGDRSVVRGAYAKPGSGAVVAILDSGEERSGGLTMSGLLEMYRGDGLYLLSQVPVVALYDEEPMARELLGRLVGYAAGEHAFMTPSRTLSVVAAEDGAMVKRMEAIGASMEVLPIHRSLFTVHSSPSPVDGSLFAVDRSPFLLDAPAGRALSPADRAALSQSLHDGATVVVAGADPEDAAWLSELAGCAVRLGVPPHEAWDGRGMRSAWTPLTAGLSQIDLYWKRFDSAQNARGQAEDVNYVIEPFQDYSAAIAAKEGVESVWPGALIEAPIGKGRLVLDQRNLYTAHPDLAARAVRNLSALVMGIGGRIDPPAPDRQLPSRRRYRAIDLAPFVNRALADETAGDGQGGWTDEGAEADMRTFSTQNRKIGNVPFEFAKPPLQAVALAHPDTPLGASLPEQVVIPLDDAIEGLYFLHTVANLASGAAARYTIAYEDGTSHSVRLELGATIRDWTNPGGLTGRRGTSSSVAWTGSTPRYPLVGLNRMEWVNPWPEKRVSSLTFSLPPRHGGLPLLLAVTAVLKEAPPAERRVRPVRAEAGGGGAQTKAAQARERAEAAAAALREGDETRAAALVAEALALDPALEGAHAVRADLSERTGNEDEMLKVYRDWVAAGAKIPRPYNRVGEILERREDWRGARAAYARSLELEWNQPPVIAAKSRMEQKLK